MEKYNLDAEMLRPYFQLDKVIDGVFGLANKLYGITFQENKDIPVYTILMSRHTRYSIRMAAIWQSSMPTSSLARASREVPG